MVADIFQNNCMGIFCNLHDSRQMKKLHLFYNCFYSFPKVLDGSAKALMIIFVAWMHFVNFQTKLKESHEIRLGTNMLRNYDKGPFKYYVSKEVGGWVRKWQFLLIYSTIYADVGGWAKKSQQHADVILEWSLSYKDSNLIIS